MLLLYHIGTGGYLCHSEFGYHKNNKTKEDDVALANQVCEKLGSYNSHLLIKAEK